LTTPPLRIGIDYDSTVWPTYEVWRKITGNPLFAPRHIATWDDPVTYAGGMEAFEELNRQSLTYEAMNNHSPFPGCIDTLIELQGLGVHQSLITARPEADLAAVARILGDHGYAPAVAVSRSGIGKVQYCLENDISLLVEDEPDTIRAAHEARLMVTSLRYRYNAAVIDELDIPHDEDWYGLKPIIFELLGLQV
jgi:phosphoglycolate phosphatase-like HAD superfamily hydrolase